VDHWNNLRIVGGVTPGRHLSFRRFRHRRSLRHAPSVGLMFPVLEETGGVLLSLGRSLNESELQTVESRCFFDIV